MTIEDFVNTWQYETAATVKVFEALSDNVLQEKFKPNVRNLATLAYHIINTLGEMGGQAGLPLNENKNQPSTAKAIAELYQAEANALVTAVKNNWTDEALKDDVMMYGQTWKKGSVLNALVFHQCHHRGQMTVLMRFAGLKVPGVYGPAFEEWESYGMKAPVE